MIRLRGDARPRGSSIRDHLTLAVAGGGTAGHVIPGLAVLEEWRRTVPGVELFFIGGSGGFEDRLTADAGFELVRLPSSPFARQGLAGKGRSGLNALRAAVAARRLLLERRPAFVLGFGGYPSAPALAAARWCGIAAALHEANVEPGLGNRLSARFVDRIFLGWKETETKFANGNSILVGNPLPQSRLPSAEDAHRAPRGGPARILVTGGSEGSPQLNAEAPKLLGETRRQGQDLAVTHLCGWGNPETIAQSYQDQGVSARVESLVDNLADLYRECDAVISTAGAFTLAELAAWRLPALLAPLESAANRHQHANATAFAERTGAELEWSSAAVARMLALQRTEPAIGAESPHQPNAAKALAAACLAMLD